MGAGLLYCPFRWRRLAIGAVGTSLLFAAGTFLIGRVFWQGELYGYVISKASDVSEPDWLAVNNCQSPGAR